MVVSAAEELVELDDGARLWTVTEGEGRPLVACHGGPGGTDTLAPFAGDAEADPAPAEQLSLVRGESATHDRDGACLAVGAKPRSGACN
jgi:hypothetical protein